MMVFLLHHADNGRRCVMMYVFWIEKKLFISCICMFCLVNMLL